MCSLKVRKYHRKIPVLESIFNKVAGLRACNFIIKKLQQRCFPVKFAKFLKTPFLTEHLRWLLHYHCKIHLYRLRISLTIQLNFALFLPAYIFLQSYSKLFLRLVKGLRTTKQILGVFFYFIFISTIVVCTSLFTLNCLYFLHLLICTNVLFILLYELDKIVKILAMQKLRRNFLD